MEKKINKETEDIVANTERTAEANAAKRAKESVKANAIPLTAGTKNLKHTAKDDEDDVPEKKEEPKDDSENENDEDEKPAPKKKKAAPSEEEEEVKPAKPAKKKSLSKASEELKKKIESMEVDIATAQKRIAAK